MVKIYVAEAAVVSYDELLFHAQKLNAEDRERVLNAPDFNCAKLILTSRLLLARALKDYCGAESFTLIKEEGGKPRLISPQGVFCSLSHSGGYAAVALSDAEVGVDIQQMRGGDLRVAERFFSSGEKNFLRAAGENCEQLFYRLWAVKESAVKALGTGLKTPFSSFTAHICADETTLTGLPGLENLRVKEYFSLPDYALACCCARQMPQKITEVSLF